MYNCCVSRGLRQKDSTGQTMLFRLSVDTHFGPTAFYGNIEGSMRWLIFNCILFPGDWFIEDYYWKETKQMDEMERFYLQ